MCAFIITSQDKDENSKVICNSMQLINKLSESMTRIHIAFNTYLKCWYRVANPHKSFYIVVYSPNLRYVVILILQVLLSTCTSNGSPGKVKPWSQEPLVTRKRANKNISEMRTLLKCCESYKHPKIYLTFYHQHPRFDPLHDDEEHQCEQDKREAEAHSHKFDCLLNNLTRLEKFGSNS